MLLYKKLLLMTFGTTLVYKGVCTLAFLVRHAKRMRHIILSTSTILFHITSQKALFSGKGY